MCRLLITKCYDAQIKEDEMGGVCSTHSGEYKYFQILGLSLKGNGHSEDLCVDGRTMLR
jgi:hypothetical protein